MTWLEFDESAEFGKNEEAKAETTQSESDSDESNGMKDYAVASAVSTFATKVTSKKAKTKNFTNVDTSDDVSAFTQVTQGTMETRMVEIESQIVDFTAGIKTLIEQNKTKRQIQVDEDKLQANQEKFKAK